MMDTVTSVTITDMWLTASQQIKRLCSVSISMQREHIVVLYSEHWHAIFFVVLRQFLTDIPQDLTTRAVWGDCQVGSQRGGASVARFPVVLMTGLPSLSEQKEQLGPCLLPSRFQRSTVTLRWSAENRRSAGHREAVARPTIPLLLTGDILDIMNVTHLFDWFLSDTRCQYK